MKLLRWISLKSLWLRDLDILLNKKWILMKILLIEKKKSCWWGSGIDPEESKSFIRL